MFNKKKKEKETKHKKRSISFFQIAQFLFRFNGKYDKKKKIM